MAAAAQNPNEGDRSRDWWAIPMSEPGIIYRGRRPEIEATWMTVYDILEITSTAGSMT